MYRLMQEMARTEMSMGKQGLCKRGAESSKDLEMMPSDLSNPDNGAGMEMQPTELSNPNTPPVPTAGKTPIQTQSPSFGIPEKRMRTHPHYPGNTHLNYAAPSFTNNTIPSNNTVQFQPPSRRLPEEQDWMAERRRVENILAEEQEVREANRIAELQLTKNEYEKHPAEGDKFVPPVYTNRFVTSQSPAFYSDADPALLNIAGDYQYTTDNDSSNIVLDDPDVVRPQHINSPESNGEAFWDTSAGPWNYEEALYGDRMPVDDPYATFEQDINAIGNGEPLYPTVSVSDSTPDVPTSDSSTADDWLWGPHRLSRPIEEYSAGATFYDEDGAVVKNPEEYTGVMYDEEGTIVVNHASPDDRAIDDEEGGEEPLVSEEEEGGGEPLVSEEEGGEAPLFSEELDVASGTMDEDALKSYQTALATLGVDGEISPTFRPNIVTEKSSASMAIPMVDGRVVTLNTEQLQRLSAAMGHGVVGTSLSSGDLPYSPMGSRMEYKNCNWGGGPDVTSPPQFTEVIHGQNVDGTPVDIYRNLQDGRIWVGGKDGTNHLGPAQGITPVTNHRAVVNIDGKPVPCANGIAVVTKMDGSRILVDAWSGNIVDPEDMTWLGKERGTVEGNGDALHSDIKLDDTAPISRLFRAVEANDDGTYTVHYISVLDDETMDEVDTDVISSVDELPRSCLNRRGAPITDGNMVPMSVQEIQDVFDTDDMSAYMFDTARLVRSMDGSEYIVLNTDGGNSVTLDPHSVSGRYLYGLLWNKDTDMGVRAKEDGPYVKYVRHADGSVSMQPVAFTPYTGKPAESAEYVESGDTFAPLGLGPAAAPSAAAHPDTKKEDSVEKAVSKGIDWDAVKYFMMLGLPIGAAIGLAMHMVGGKDSSLIANLLGGAAGGALLGGLGAGTGLLKYTKSDNSNGSAVSNAPA